MKKYLIQCIPLNPRIFIFLSLVILQSDIVFAIGSDDTTYYYNERGKLLWCNVKAASAATYVVRTKQSFNQVFDDIPLNDSTMQLSDGYNTAMVNGISRRTARRVQRLIQHGAIDNPLVVKNIVPVLDKRIIRRMYDNIVSRCAAGDAHKYKEHGGVVFPDGTVTCISGEGSDPNSLKGAGLLIKEKALVYYHSHPDGYVEQQQPRDRFRMYNPDRVEFSQTSQVQLIGYVQGPSRQDQVSVGEGTGYVFGMKASGGLIYIYDKEGVKATLPISFVKKMRISAEKTEPTIDSYFAGLIRTLPLSWLF
ncbi:hypothetical protein A3860_25845 [Niastella vici]|uniref:Uncharacterized protein n=1 Tax=Niastella vici TaxID=1703345 RepID=A0A1V9FY82_9BACT|nr:hypothetical protein [Niastella vici]OQP63315.1 hypothetical protein A3860_25845 [Niastella vici]